MHSHVRIFIMINRVIKKIKRHIYRSRFYLQNKATLDKNKDLKNSRTGQRCFIIGTGPSIKDQDLTKLRNEATFVVNTFWNHPNYAQINPKYYVLIDSEAFPNQKGRGQHWINDLIEKSKVLGLCPDTKLFFHINGKELVEQGHLFPNNEVFYLDFQGFFKENLKFNIDLTHLLPNPKNVIVASLIIATYMGFEEIYLLGCEHDGLAYPSDKHYEGFKHFYKNPEYKTSDTNSVEYFALDIMPYEAHLHHYKILFQNYRLFKEKISKERPKVKIYNATPNSFLDVFPFVKFEDIKI